MLWIVVAAQLSAPVAVDGHSSDVRGLFSYDDVPAYLIRAGEVSRTVYTRTTVRDDGSLENCAIEVSSGDTKLDAYTCALIVKRAKLAPARWIDGTRAYSVLRFPVSWTVTESVPSDEKTLKAVVPDIELSVNQLPKGAHKIVDITLEVAADEAGQIMFCLELPPEAKDSRRHFPQLVPIACDQAKKSLLLRPPLDPSGKPMRSVQTASVRLSLDH
jgi:hypothetical protein